MARNFPHIADSEFPNVSNVDVYKYQNNIDYSRFDYTQMEITICSVPWDMGEAHVGNRTISGIGNVVYFEDKKARDAWFASLDDSECYRFATKLRQLHSDNIIDVPLPFDIASKYNYCYVRYSLVANDNSLLQYEHDGGLREWFWFIREVEFLSPNTTRLHLMADAWQTFIYDLDITGMMLERGHAPMAAINATDYLADPISNCELLLAPDEDFGEGTGRVRSTSSHIFNSDDTIAVFVSSADVRNGTWGSKTGTSWETPGIDANAESGYPTFYLFGVAVSNLQSFISNMQSQVPQFAQTLKGIFFISQSLFAENPAQFTFCNTTCYALDPVGNADSELWEATKSAFGYPEKYAEIAKLYTWPYAHLEVTDENGSVTILRVEETAGELLLESSLNALFPQIAVNAHLIGYGSAESQSVTFKSIDSHSFDACGKWYDTLYSWNIPLFGIVQDAGIQNDYATHYDRAHQYLAYQNAYSNQVANANTVLANASAQQTANTANTTIDDYAAQRSELAATNLADDMCDSNSTQTTNTANNSIDLQYANAAISSASSTISSVMAAGNAMSKGDSLGTLSAVVNGVVDIGATIASTNAGVNYTAANAGEQVNANARANSATRRANFYKETTAENINHDRRDVTNTLIDTTAANTSGTMLANAVRDAATAQDAIDKQIAQANLNVPAEFGQISDASIAASRPLGLFVNTVTESDWAIARAGDEFLRYGYNLNRYWEFDGNWNVGDRFTYWKLSDFWVKGLNIPDMYVDKIRFFLFGGVTVWSAPEYIGNTSIYENGL